MTARGTPKQVGDLLAHARWVKRIAADLVDADLAEDVAQDVWVTSIRRPPAEGSALRAWLRTVVTNLVRSGYRSDRRRQARETALSLAAEGVSSDTPEELTIRLQLQRRLAEQILTLREPYRQAVVYRYVDDLSAAQIARLLHVPAGTVRRRIKVGLDRLREALRDQLQERERWARLLVPLAPAHLRLVPSDGQRLPGRPGKLPLPPGTRSGQALLVGALLVLPMITVAVLRWAAPAEPARTLRSEPAAVSLRAPVFTPAALLHRETSSQSEERAGVPNGFAGDQSTAVTGRVLDTDGNGLAGATVTAWSPHRQDQPARGVLADERGRYEIALPTGRYVLRATSPGYAKGMSWVDLRGSRLVDLRLHLKAQLVGRVVERATGQPLPGGLVTASSRQVSGQTVEVDGAGAFSLTVDAGGYRVSARRGGLYGVSEPIRARPGESATVLVALAPTAAIQGRVRGEAATDGSGLGGVKVSARAVSDLPVCRGFQATTTTASDGGYRLEGLPSCGLAIEFVAPRHVRRSVPVADWAGVADRRVDTWLAAASVLTGQVRDAGGAPVARARIEVGARAQAVETPTADGTRPKTASPRRLTSDEAGRFEVDRSARRRHLDRGSARARGGLDRAGIPGARRNATGIDRAGAARLDLRAGDLPGRCLGPGFHPAGHRDPGHPDLRLAVGGRVRRGRTIHHRPPGRRAGVARADANLVHGDAWADFGAATADVDAGRRRTESRRAFDGRWPRGRGGRNRHRQRWTGRGGRHGRCVPAQRRDTEPRFRSPGLFRRCRTVRAQRSAPGKAGARGRSSLARPGLAPGSSSG